MLISNLVRPVQQGVTPPGRVEGKYSLNLPVVAKKINRIAIAALVLYALANLPGAEAGPASYATCIASCLALATPVAAPACTVGCLALAGPWCP
ncbi:MAG: hypothetical protein P0S96_02195 [Simkaniaceae bacterium]|nr:hypothetical protein [Candidatus Sacchlamyda saccharinae]